MNHPDQQKQAEGAAPIPDAVPTPSPRPSDRQARLERFLARASLNPEHISELRKSGITYDQALRAGFRTMTNRESIREILCWKKPPYGFGPSLFIPYRNTDGVLDGEYMRIKPGHPREETKSDGSKKPVKYESPRGRPNRLYFPPGVVEALRDPTRAIIFTEGEKKALKATLEGFPTVGLVGVAGWSRSRPTGANGRPSGVRQLLPDFDAFSWAGRPVTIIYDSDVARTPQVRREERALARELDYLGAKVGMVGLPDLLGKTGGGVEKCGLDDFLVANGAEALRKLLSENTMSLSDERPDASGRSDRADRGGYPKYQIGDRVSPSDRNNVGTVIEILADDQYLVLFVSREGVEARKEFHASDLKPVLRTTRGEPDAEQPTGPPPPWAPFPVEGLPESVRTYCETAALSLRVDPACVAVPALAVLAGAVGNSRAVRIKESWHEPSILWTAIIAEPGGAKSPSLGFAKKPLSERQNEECKSYDQALLRWSEEKARAKRLQREPDPKLEPKLKHLIVDDITTEALGLRLADNPRGVLCQPDELRRWIGSFDKYRSGKGGGDRPFWLTAHDGLPIKIDRKTPDRPVINVPRAAVSLTGGVQPAVWQKELADKEADEDGLAARLLHAMPPDKGGGWSDVDVDASLYDRCAGLVRELLALELQAGSPLLLPLDPGARELFVALTNEIARTRPLAADWERPVVAKLNKHAARLALVLQLSDDPKSAEVSGRWMEVGIRLAKWFHEKACRVRLALGLDPVEKALDRLEGAIEMNGGRLTPGDMIERNRRRYPDSPAATAALDDLVRRRPLKWMWVDQPPGSEGGRPSRWVERAKVPDPPPQEDPEETGNVPEP